jgi:hypothetical protein
MKTVINHNPLKNIHFDSIYINPRLESLLQALEELGNRQTVMVVFENDLERNDRFDFTRTFPFHLFETPSLVREFHIQKQVMKLAPHLFQTRKVLYISKTRPINFTALFADYLYRNTYQKKSQVLMPNQLEQLSFIRERSRKGIYFQEYEYNGSRLFIELLKYFESQGGTIKVKSSVKTEKDKLTFLQTKETATAGNIIFCTSKKTTNYLVPIEMPPGFSMVYRSSKLAFRFTSHQKMLLAEPLNQTSEKVSKKVFLAFAQSLFLPKIEKITKTERIENPSPKVMKKLTEQIKHPPGCAFKKTYMKDMHERCLEKFDLAKQTGISYANFKVIFHRYGTAVDEMTEDAYILMNEFRDPEKIWNLAEKNYQKMNEWSI